MLAVICVNKTHNMAKLYPNCTPKSQNLNPKDETVQHLLNYSKALSVICYNKLKFEALLN